MSPGAEAPSGLLLLATKQVSVAQAKNSLPALLREAESAPVEIVRRGTPVAVILSRADYDRLCAKNEGVWASVERFRATHDLEELDAASAFEGVRDTGPEGRPVHVSTLTKPDPLVLTKTDPPVEPEAGERQTCA